MLIFKTFLNNKITKNLYYLAKGDKLKFALLLLLTVGSSFLELLGMGLLIPIVFIKFLPNSKGVTGRIERIAELFGIGQNENVITYLMIGFVSVLIFRSFLQIAYVYLQGKLLGKWRVKAESLLLKNHLLAKIDGDDIQDRSKLQIKINAVSKFLDKSVTSIFEAIAASVIIACFLIVLIIIDPTIAIAGFATVIILAAIRMLLIRYTSAFDDELDFSLSARQKKAVDDTVNLIKEIKIYRKEQFFYTKFNYLNRRLINLMKKGRTISIMPDALTQMIFVGIIGAVVLFLPSRSDFFNGQKIAFTIFVTIRLLPRISRMQRSLINIEQGKKGSTILRQAIHLQQHSSLLFQREAVQVFDHLEFRNVFYQHNKKNTKSGEAPLFSDVNFIINKGKFVGIVGPSGAGKTTLLEMIAGLRKPTIGTIIVDGSAISEKKTQWAGIGYLSQNTSTVAGGLLENVAFGRKKNDIDKQLVRRILNDVGLMRIWKRERTLTDAEEIIEQLSAGEKQRLGLARALYAAKDILLLDEPTSNLDNATEQAILEIIRKQRGKLTIIMIAHRLETLQDCDCLFHVKDGHVKQINK